MTAPKYKLLCIFSTKFLLLLRLLLLHLSVLCR
jgi:hypothetical protein